MNQFFTDKNKKYFIFHISSSEVIGSIVSFNQIKQKPNIDFSISEEILFNKILILKNFTIAQVKL